MKNVHGSEYKWHGTGDWGGAGAIRSGVEEGIQERIEIARPENAAMLLGQIFH